VAVAAVCDTGQLAALQRECRKAYVDPALITYAVKLVTATRDPGKAGLADLSRHILYGASPRATIALIEGGRALAFLRGRDYVLPEDVADIAPDVLRHRIVLSYEALTDRVTPDKLVAQLMRRIPAPPKPMDSHARAEAES
jgi:MoxR-like ATPase